MISDERISCWLDGELGKDEAAEMEALCCADPAVQARVEALRRVDGLVHKAVPLDPVPAELLQRLGLADAAPSNVVPLHAGKDKRQAVSRWTAANEWGRIAAAAAMLLGIGLTAGTLTRVGGVASPDAEYRTLSDGSASHAGNGLVVFESDLSAEGASAIVTGAGARLGQQTPAGAWQVHIPPQHRSDVLTRLRANPHVLMAEPLDGERQ